MTVTSEVVKPAGSGQLVAHLQTGDQLDTNISTTAGARQLGEQQGNMDVRDGTAPIYPTLTILKVFYAYTFGTATWLGVQALPLLVAPKLIITMLSSEAHSITGELCRLMAKAVASIPIDCSCRS